MGLLLPIVALSVAVTYLCVSSIRLVFFHPLSRFPGPKLAALSNWYQAYYAWRGDLHIKIREWHDTYGSTVRIGPNGMSFNSASANEQINAVRAKTVKTDGYSSFSASRTTANTISAIDKATHGFKRRIQSQVLSEAGLKEIEDRVVRHVQEFVKYLGSTEDAGESVLPRSRDGWGPEREMSEACNYMTYNVISDLCYGESLDLFHSSEMRWFPKAVALFSRRVVMGLAQPKFNDYKLDRVVFGFQRSRMFELGAWINQRSNARAALGNDVKQKDVFYAMMNTSDPKTGEYLSAKDLWLEAMMVLIAGSDTSSTAMAGVMYYLLHNPDALATVTSEVRSQFGSVDDITPARVASDCKLIRACIDEAMRLSPPVVHGPPRRVEAGGIQINGEYFAEGTVLQGPIYTLHRNEAHFEEPDEYKPQRWMVDDESLRKAQQAFAPFHIGPYSCVGWRLAMMELTTSLARIVYSYDMRLPPQAPCCNSKPAGSKCQYVLKGWMTSIAEGPVAQFKARDE